MVELILEVTRRITDSAGTVISVWQGVFAVGEMQQALILHDTACAAGAEECRLMARNETHQHLAIKSKLDYDRAVTMQNRQPQPPGILIPMGEFDPSRLR